MEDKKIDKAEDYAKMEFITITVLVDSLRANLLRIDRGSLARAIEFVPEEAKNDQYYKILCSTLDFYDKMLEVSKSK